MAKLKINRGTTYVISVQYQEDGVNTSLSGATVRFTVKTEEFTTSTTDADAVITKNVTDGTAEGVATITIDPADTATLVPDKYFYDIKVALPTGQVYKIDEGTIQLDGSPTNRLA